MKKRTFYLLCAWICCILPLYISSGLCTVNNQFHYGFNSSGSIRVMTFNIRGARSDNGEVNLHGVADQIKKMDPDIVALQEVDFRLPRSHFQNQTRILGELLQMNYLFVPNQNFLIGSYGNAIFSKFPITDFDRHLLPSSIENRGVLRAQIHTGTQPIDVYATHLGLHPKEISRQVSSIATTMALNNGPKLLLGDFNSKPIELSIQSIRTSYIDPVYERKMDIVTYQHRSKKMQLDYIFFTDDFLFEDAFTEVSNISDHHPLMYSLLLSGNGN